MCVEYHLVEYTISLFVKFINDEIPSKQNAQFFLVKGMGMLTGAATLSHFEIPWL